MAHDHDHGITDKNLSLSIVLNAVITLAQIIGGFVSGSLSLISDALHNLSDVLSLILSLIAHRLAKRKATAISTFGYKRAEILVTFINAATLIIVAVFLMIEAVERFSNPVFIRSELVIILSVIGIAFNGFSAMLIKKDAAHNINMKSAYIHLFTDMLASVGVLIGGILMYYFQWFWVDAALTFSIALYLIYMGFGILKTSVKMLMLFTPQHLKIEKILEIVHQKTGIHQLYHIHLWHLNDNAVHFEAHLDCKENMTITEFNKLTDAIEEVLLHEFQINHCTIQPEFEKKGAKEFIIQE